MSAIYIHIPYCVKKCDYCDFCSVPLNESAARYCDLLRQEIGLWNGKRKGGKAEIHSIFFGGGTPTSLPAAHIVSVLEAIHMHFSVADDAEISIECNPKTATEEGLALLHKAGFNRLSIGLQSADDELLGHIGRVHTYADFLHTLDIARSADFVNINVDVMHGLPRQTQKQYLETLRLVCDLDVEHISAYALILEKDTPLYRQVEIEQTLSLPDEDAVADMQDAGMTYLAERGYTRYEVSNFAKDGRECRHNLVYWNNEAYVGFGVAAHSSMPDGWASGADKTGDTWLRAANVEDIPVYEKRLRRNKLPTAETIKLYASEQMFESVMLGLRKVEGVDRAAFQARFGVAVDDVFANAIAEVSLADLWEDCATHLRLNPRGMDMLNSVLVSFR